MNVEVNIHDRDEVYIKIDCDRGIARELSEYFTFEVPGAKFMPAYRNKYWDGKIRLFNTASFTIYKGLLDYIKVFCQEREYKYILHDQLDSVNDISLPDLKEMFNSVKYVPRDYQFRAIAHALRHNRALIVSPTASGKSLIIYCIIQYILSITDGKVLLIVPTTSLVHQMSTDFIDYSGNPQLDDTHKIMSGQEKFTDKRIIISTWQSIYKLPKNWFDQFDCVIGDEAHLFKAQSLTKIMTKLDRCKYRFGFTGTLDGTQTHKLVLEGLFGSAMKVIDTKELIDKGTLSDFRIKALVLEYPEKVCKELKQKQYQDEIKFLIANDQRNRFIKNLALSRTGNTLVLYQMVEKHGEILYNLITDAAEQSRQVYFVHGGIDADTRENIRHWCEESKDTIIVASYGTFSTGINIRNLHNVIFASPSKSRVRNLQSIGRALRKGDNKEVATLYDIADNLSHKSWNNYTLKHFGQRIKMYNEEQFDYKIYKIRIKDE